MEEAQKINSRYDTELKQQFILFCSLYGKSYTDRGEFYKRRHYFEVNLRRICSLDGEQSSACLIFNDDSEERPDKAALDVGLNEMADWSDEEAKKRLMDGEFNDNYEQYWNRQLANVTELTTDEIENIL